MGPQIMNNIERGQAIARLLFESFRNKGIHWRNEMPEDEPPPGVQGGSLDHVLFITQTVAINYQRDGDALWESSRKTFANAETRYVFDPAAVHANRRGFARTCRNTAFPKTEEGLRYLSDRRDHLPQEMEGDPSNFLADCGWDAVTILQRLSADTYLVAGPCRPDYPYLSGPKIGPLWLRMLIDNVGLSIQRFGRSANSRRCSHCTGLVGDRNRPG
jgi:hypothetical protein